MINKLKIIVLIIIFSLISFTHISVKALSKVSLKYENQNSIWYTMQGGGKPSSSLPYLFYYLDNKVVFCIKPGVNITTNNYFRTEGFTNSPYSSEINQKLELIGYYGYEYPNHRSAQYRMATQALIWELVSGQTVEFWTQPYGQGTLIDVSNEKNEILDLIEKNKSLSLINNEIEATLNEETSLIDTDGILSQYEILENQNIETKIIDDKLYIKPLKLGHLKLNLKKKIYNDKSYIYIGEDGISQPFGYFGITEPIIITVDIISKGKLEIRKLGEKIEFNEEIETNYIPLKNVEFSLYALENIIDYSSNIKYEKNALIDVLKTDENGKVIFNNLYLGKYKVIETKTLQGYEFDNKEYSVVINDKNEILEIKNNLKKVAIKVPNTEKNSRCLNFILLGFLILIYAKIN